MVAVPCAVGKTAARAGRSTPGMAPSTILAVAMAAPVLPAVTKPAALPSRTMRKSDAHGRVAFGAYGLRRLLLHADDFAGIDDADRQPAPEAMQFELGADRFLSADQHDFHVVVACGENGAFHFGFGRAISAHGVKSDDGRHFCLSVANLDWYGALDSATMCRCDCPMAGRRPALD